MMTEPQLDARGEAHEALSSVVAAYGPQNSTFATLNTWWTNHADPAAAPTPAASPSS